jgi:hypothetical protein
VTVVRTCDPAPKCLAAKSFITELQDDNYEQEDAMNISDDLEDALHQRILDTLEMAGQAGQTLVELKVG